MKPLVSIVIPLYNKGPYIKRTLRSVLSQTIKVFEVIVVDDGSTDEGPDIVESFDDARIRLIRQENAGVSVARNKGIKEAKADYIAFLDADDEWKPTYLETVFRLRAKYPEAGIYAAAYCISRNKIIKIPNFKGIPPSPWEGIIPRYFLSATEYTPVTSSTACIPKKIFTEIGGFQTGVKWGEDLDMWGRVALKYPIAFSWDIGAIYHFEAINRACNNTVQTYEHPFVLTANNYLKNRNISNNILEDLKEYIAFLQIMTASCHVCAGNTQISLDILKNCETKAQKWERRKWLLLAYTPKSIINAGRKLKQLL